MKRLISVTVSAVMLFLPIFSGITFAQEKYPSKPIRLVVPYPPGGGTDIVSRLIASNLSDALSVQVIVDNRGGAAGTIGIGIAAKGAADGYTLVMGQTSNLSIGPALYKNLPYDALKDFAPVTLVDSAPLAISVSAKSKFKSLEDLITTAKSKSDGLIFASPGNGTVAHLTGELLKKTIGIKFVHVPYKGAAQAMPDLIAGRVDFYISSLESAKPYAQSGTIRVLAITSSKRSPDTPDIPTVSESGYKGFEASTWWGILAPAGTPAPIIKRLSDEIAQILKKPDVNKRLGSDSIAAGPQEFAKVLKADHAKWARIVNESGVKVD